MDKRKQGIKGEDIACSYLKQQGYEILRRNYYTRYGEIDIIAQEEKTLVFIEVKMRSSNKYGIGAEAITAKKIEKIITCAQLYLQENNLINQDIRFDVIDIMGKDAENINHIKAAF